MPVLEPVLCDACAACTLTGGDPNAMTRLGVRTFKRALMDAQLLGEARARRDNATVR